jgi:hypothetical protein
VNQPAVITGTAPVVGVQSDYNNALTDGKNYTGAQSIVTPAAFWSAPANKYAVSDYASWPCTGKSKKQKNVGSNEAALYVTQTEYTLQFRNVPFASLPDLAGWIPVMTGTIKRLEASMRHDITNYGLYDG